MAFAQLPMTPSFTLNRGSGSGATADDSPFGSVLNTPDDENVPYPIETLGKQLDELKSRNSPGAAYFSSVSKVMDLNEKNVMIERNQEDGSAATPRPSSRDIANLTGSVLHSSSRLVNPRDEIPPSPSDSQPLDGASPLLTTNDLHAQSMNDDTVSSARESPATSPEIDSQSFGPHSRAPSIYNLPNVSISTSELQTCHLDSSTEPSQTSEPLAATSTPVQDEPSLASSQEPQTAETQLGSEDEFSLLAALQGLTFQQALVTISKIICFVPWCVLVGGTIVLSPGHLEKVTFASGYLASPRGIHRFAHWSDVAVPHIMIFLAFLVMIVWWAQDIRITIGLVAAVVSQFVTAWQDFKVDETVPLGENDRQTIYWVVQMYLLSRESAVAFYKTDRGFFISTAESVDKAQDSEDNDGVEDGDVEDN